MAKRNLSIVTWKDVRLDVIKVNKELGRLIDAIDPGNSYKFVRADYLFGDLFVKKGRAQFPHDQGLSDLSHPSINEKIRQEVGYCPLPLFLTLKKSAELFVNEGKRVVPLNLFHEGDLSGVYEAMDYMMGRQSDTPWNFSAGSRSIFMLPKITDTASLKKLHMRYGIPSTVRIERLVDHWELFKGITNSNNFTEDWQSTILFFGKKWLDDKYCSQAWNKFRKYLYQVTWEHANFVIAKIKFNICWELFTWIIYSRRLQPNPYLIEQVKHLLSIVNGDFPAFTVMNGTEESAPSRGLQEAFVEHYGLKQYLPTLMHACMSQDAILKPNYVYYSLSIPTVLEGSPLKKTSSTLISDLREIKLLIEILKNHFKHHPDLERSHIIEKTNFDFFHYEKDACNQVRSSSNLPAEDPGFLSDQNLFPERSFCPTSPFFSGCIRLKCK